MKKIHKFILAGLGVMAISSGANAMSADVNFPAGQSNGSFNCTVSDPATTVTIDTSQLEINGGCAGSPFVTSDGHLTGVPATVLQNNYFEITKHLNTSGKVTVTAVSGGITCSLEHGAKTKGFGNGKYCLK